MYITLIDLTLNFKFCLVNFKYKLDEQIYILIKFQSYDR
jgi:hypothetical protein